MEKQINKHGTTKSLQFFFYDHDVFAIHSYPPRTFCYYFLPFQCSPFALKINLTKLSIDVVIESMTKLKWLV